MTIRGETSPEQEKLIKKRTENGLRRSWTYNTPAVFHARCCLLNKPKLEITPAKICNDLKCLYIYRI